MKIFIVSKLFARKDSEGYWNLMNVEQIAAFQSRDEAIAKVDRCLEGAREMFGGIITNLWDEKCEKITYSANLVSGDDRYQMNVTWMELK